MDQLITKELVQKAQTDPEVAEYIADWAQKIIIGLCLQPTEDDEEDDGDDDQDAKICPHCGQLTLYSSRAVALGVFPAMCLSKDCILKAVLELSGHYNWDGEAPTNPTD